MHYSNYPLERSLSDFMYRVYGWMALALAMSAGVALFIARSPQMYLALHQNPYLLIGIFIAQFALVISLSMFLQKMSPMAAFILFMIYAASVGVTLSSIFLVYDITSIYATFFVTAGMFASMCVYGYFTQTDLTRFGNILLMALIGLILAMLVNIFLKSAALDFALSALGVLLFTGLTAYDAQKIKQIGQQLLGDQETMHKVAVLGALTLYLDFINLFLFLLRFMGKRRD